MIVINDLEYFENKVKGSYVNFENKLEITEYHDGTFTMDDISYELGLDFRCDNIPKIVNSLDDAIMWCNYYVDNKFENDIPY